MVRIFDKKQVSTIVLFCLVALNCFAQDEELDESNLTFKPEYGISFDGSTTYIFVDESEPFNLEEFTLETWVRFNDTHENQVFMNRGAAGRDFTFYLYDRVRFLVGSDDGYSHANAFVPPADTWVHITGVFTFGGVKRIYYNGVLMHEEPSFSFMWETDHPLYIGALEPGLRHMDGELENLRIWNRALTDEEILDLVQTKPEDENISDMRANGLVAYWAARSVQGTVVNDLSGNGHDGIFNTFTVDESHLSFKPDAGMTFDGETTYAIVENGEPFNSDQISFETWIYVDPILHSRTAGFRGIVGRGPSSEYIGIYSTSHFGNHIHTSIQLLADTAAPIPPSNSWVHVCATFDQSQLILYYNGILATETEAVGEMIPWGDVPIFIGVASDVEGYTPVESQIFVGKMENIRIWNKALSENEIQDLLSVNPADENITEMKQDGLLAYFSSRAIDGSTLTDLSGNGNDAVIIGDVPVLDWALDE